jgi:hypothetical protein
MLCGLNGDNVSDMFFIEGVIDALISDCYLLFHVFLSGLGSVKKPHPLRGEAPVLT